MIPIAETSSLHPPTAFLVYLEDMFPPVFPKELFWSGGDQTCVQVSCPSYSSNLHFFCTLLCWYIISYSSWFFPRLHPISFLQVRRFSSRFSARKSTVSLRHSSSYSRSPVPYSKGIYLSVYLQRWQIQVTNCFSINRHCCTLYRKLCVELKALLVTQ